ncbi:MAG: hypothetical protein WCF18_16390, partial [Chthoniobacteraceae bacterium]
MLNNTFRRLIHGSREYGLVRDLAAAQRKDFAIADRGGCIHAADITEESIRLFGRNLAPHVDLATFLRQVREATGVLPDAYAEENEQVARDLAQRGLVLPLDAAASGSVGGAYSGGGSADAGARAGVDMQRMCSSTLSQLDEMHGVRLRQHEGDLERLQCEERAAAEQARAALSAVQRRREEVLAAEAELAALEAELQETAGGASGSGVQTRSRSQEQQQQLEQQTSQAEARVAALRTGLTTEEHQHDAALAQHQAACVAVATQGESVMRLKEDYLCRRARLLESGEAKGSMRTDRGFRLRDVCYFSGEGTEQAIALPTLKVLIMARCVLCVPTPAQVRAMSERVYQGKALFATERVREEEDVAQFGARVSMYVQAGQLVGAAVNPAVLFLMGLKDRKVRERLSAAMDAHCGAMGIEDAVRKALDITHKQQSQLMVLDMRGMAGGRETQPPGSPGPRSPGPSSPERRR